MATWTMKLPVPVEFGQDCVNKLPTYLAGKEKVMLITGKKAMKKTGVTAQLCKLFDEAGCKWRLFDNVSSDPDHLEIEAATEVAKSFDAQVIIGCGGGSALDAAKGVAVGAKHKGPIFDYIVDGPREITSATLPIIAINSTSGTGSHIGRASVISDKKKHIKRVLLSDYLCPQVAFCDSRILKHMPPEVTAATGFDAFAHALEGYITKVENPMGNLCAAEAMKIIVHTLPQAIAQGQDIDLREQMAWADTLAGISLATNSISTPHVLSMLIGGRYGATHGPAIASVTIAWFRQLRKLKVAKLADIGKILGCTRINDDAALADYAIELIDQFIEKIGLKRSPAEHGLKESDIEDICAEAKRNFALRLGYDPMCPDEVKLVEILCEALSCKVL